MTQKNRQTTLFTGNVSFTSQINLTPITDSARDALAVTDEGTIIMNSTTNKLNLYDGGQWLSLLTGAV